MMPFEKDSYKWQIGHKQKIIEQYKETHKGSLGKWGRKKEEKTL